jgi:lysozyme
MSDRLKALLERHEGRRRIVYADSLGIPTIGIGRNLKGKGLSEAEVDMLYEHDIAEIRAELTRRIPWWIDLDEVRQAVLMDMAFMGVAKLMGFKVTLAAVEKGEYAAAARGMLASKWAGQVGRRADELAEMMRSGEWPRDVQRKAGV